jgi:hypothetical protein
MASTGFGDFDSLFINNIPARVTGKKKPALSV